jgi:hypothetical protein
MLDRVPLYRPLRMRRLFELGSIPLHLPDDIHRTAGANFPGAAHGCLAKEDTTSFFQKGRLVQSARALMS